MVVSLRSVILMTICSSSLAYGEVFTTQQTEDVVHFIEHLRQCRGVVGLTLAVVKGNDTWTRGFGMSDREAGREVSTSDLFGIASLTKGFTSALLSLFINETGRYSWNSPILDILGPDFRLVTKELTREVTLKDILTHRTGLETTDIPLYAGSNLTGREFVRALRYLPVKRPFRDEMDYNNWMYGLSGHVAEALDGAPWEQLLHRHLLQPLNMTETGVIGRVLTEHDDRRLATPYVTLAGKTVPSDPAISRITAREATGAMASSAQDMAKWLSLLVNNGRAQHGGQLLSEAHLKEMTSPHVTIPAAEKDRENLLRPQFPVAYAIDGYGLGWYTGNYRGYPLTWHTGMFHAYVSCLGLLPHLKLGVFVGTNGPQGDNASHLTLQNFFHIADRLLGEDPWLNVTNACHYPQLWRPAPSAAVTSSTPACRDPAFDHVHRYVGLYRHPLYGDVGVSGQGPRGLYVHYGFFEGRLCRADVENVVLLEVVGKLAFLFRPGSSARYPQLNFTRPNAGGRYQQVALSYPPSWEEALVFHRQGAGFSSGYGADCVKGFFAAIVLLVLASVFFFIR